MAETLSSAAVKITTSASSTTSPDIGTATYSFNESNTSTFTNGTANNQANMVWTDTRTIAASTSEDIDLAGVLTSALNTSITFTKIKAIIVEADSGNTNNVLVGGSSAGIAGMFVLGGDAAIEDVQIVVPPEGVFVLTAPKAGYTVTATTGDIIKVANSSSGSSVTYKIKVIGTV